MNPNRDEHFAEHDRENEEASRSLARKPARFTPGPWYVEGTNPPRVYARNGLDVIAQCDSAGEMFDDQELANARLIAAAPTLLQALKNVIAYDESLSDRYHLSQSLRDELDAVIAKAEGRA